jgi:hypothetical protein
MTAAEAASMEAAASESTAVKPTAAEAAMAAAETAASTMTATAATAATTARHRHRRRRQTNCRYRRDRENRFTQHHHSPSEIPHPAATPVELAMREAKCHSSFARPCSTPREIACVRHAQSIALPHAVELHS